MNNEKYPYYIFNKHCLKEVIYIFYYSASVTLINGSANLSQRRLRRI